MNYQSLRSIFSGSVLVLLALWSAACNKSTTGLSLGTDTGNAVGSTDTLSEEGQEGVLGVVGENQIGTSTSSNSLSSDFTGVRAAQIFPNSYLRSARFSSTCPETERTVNGNAVTITRSFSSCRPYRNAALTFDGSETVTINRSGGDDSDSATLSRSGTIVRDLEITDSSSRVLRLDISNSFQTTGTFPNFTYELEIDSSRQFSNARGRAIADYDITGSLTYTATGSSSQVTQLVASGALETRRNLADLTVNSTVTEVTWTSACSCSPVSGSISEVITVNSSGQSRTRTLSYPSCGKIRIDGVESELADCD